MNKSLLFHPGDQGKTFFLPRATQVVPQNLSLRLKFRMCCRARPHMYMKLMLLEGTVQWILHTCNCLTLEATIWAALDRNLFLVYCLLSVVYMYMSDIFPYCAAHAVYTDLNFEDTYAVATSKALAERSRSNKISSVHSIPGFTGTLHNCSVITCNHQLPNTSSPITELPCAVSNYCVLSFGDLRQYSLTAHGR